MSVWRCQELFKGRRGGLRDGTERTYTRIFQVFTNSKLDGPIEVMFAVDPSTGERIPSLYSSYANYGGRELDVLAICRNIEPVQDDNDWTVWTVTCTYDTENLNGDPRQGQASAGGNPSSGSGSTNDPSLEPPIQEWGDWRREEAATQAEDQKNTPILNAAGQPFDPAPTREIGGLTLVVERNELVFNAFKMSEYWFTTNSDMFLGFDLHQWLCKTITGKRQYKGNFKYWRVRYEFWHAKEQVFFNVGRHPIVPGAAKGPWDHILLNAGFEQLVGGKLKPITFNNQPVSRPYPLDAAGSAMTQAAIVANGPLFLHFQKYPERKFADLKLKID